MPELPEVEAARRAIEEYCVGKKIKKSTVANDAKVIDGVSPEDFEAAIAGKTIVAAHRKGKNMWLQLDSPPFPSFQFGMAGAVYIKGVAVTKYKRSSIKDTEEWPSKYSKLFVQLDDGLEFSFTDKRRFAKVRLLDNPVSVPPISELGPDVLLEPRTVDEFYDSLRKKKIGIKALLLDQSFLSGIGNWMADEVLYQARIHPLQTASSMSKESCATLLNCINEVIEKAMEVEADSSQFPVNWIFHSREKKPGKAFADGKKIDFINAGGRTTAYVPELQKLPGDQALKGATKPSKGTTADNNDSDSESENEDKPKPNVKKGRKTPQARKPSNRKLDSSHEIENEEEPKKPNVDKGKKTNQAKKPPKKKLSADDDSKDDQDKECDDSAGEDEDKEAQEVTNKKQTKVGKSSNKRVAPNPKGKPKKKAK